MRKCCVRIIFTVLLLGFTKSYAKENLVQGHINSLKNELKASPLNYKERRKLEGNLRGELNNRMYGTNRKSKKLDNPKTSALARSIINSYEDIAQKKGNHMQAAHNYAERAMGVIGLHINPRGGGGSKKSSARAAVHPTAAEPAKTKSSGWLQTIENAMGGENTSGAAQTTSSGTRGGAVAAGAAGAAGATAGSLATSKRAQRMHEKRAKRAKMSEEKKKKNQSKTKKTHPKKMRAEKQKKKAAKKRKKAAQTA